MPRYLVLALLALTVSLGLRCARNTERAELDEPITPPGAVEREPYFVERATVFVGEQRVSELVLTAAVSPDPKLRFFVRGEPAKTLRVVFVNNRGERWEASQKMA